MRTLRTTSASMMLGLVAIHSGFAEDVLFEDAFKDRLSDKWQPVGLKETDYRIRDGGLEMRVQPGKLTRDTPMLKVMLPFTSADSVVASVKITLLDEFTQDGEFAGLYLLNERGREFRGKKQLVDGRLAFAPGKYQFVGEPGEEGDPAKYDVTYTTATQASGPLRIIADRGKAFFQVGPTEEGTYLGFFFSAIDKQAREGGFGLIAAGAPEGESHWVRFEDFRVAKQ